MLAESQKSFDAEVVRQDFPILFQNVHRNRPLIYFDNAASTQRPNSVVEAMADCYRSDYANVHRGNHTLSERISVRYEQARERVRQFLGARHTNEIIFSSGTTAAINLVAHSYGERLQPGDEVMLSVMEHHSNIVPWQQLAARQGITLRWVGLHDDGSLDLEQFQSHLNSRTKLVAITMASNVLGVINPIAKLCEWSHAVGAVVMVDAAQAVPHMPVNVQELGCDFLVFSGHKMVGPTGIGVLYGREELLDAMPPFLGGGSMIETVTQDGFKPAGLPAKFEAGTPAIVEAIGLHAAIDYLETLGLEAIDQHEKRLATRFLLGLTEIPGVHILGPTSGTRVGLVSFTIEDTNSQDLAKFLDFRGFATRAGHHCAMPLHQHFAIPNSLRASFYLYNTEEEVEQLLATLPEILVRLR
ncbi:MAG: cysteine desulfurase [Planctomycetaceae bacterium]|nr:cysteine desulfurase [Planctomycetaceae bacterium]